MKAFPLFAAAMLLVCAGVHAETSGAVIREAGAIYLEDLLIKPVRLATIANAPIYYHNDLGRYLGTLKKDQIVEVQAVGDKAYRVRGIAQQGQVVGWVEPRFLNPFKKDFLENLKQNAARLAQVKELVAKNEVAINMTPEEVQQSLGKPSKKTTRVDASGREDIWEFVRYERVPQETVGRDPLTGNVINTIIYVKVPSGKVSITFANSLVSALEQTEGSLEKDAQTKIVPAPFAMTAVP